jgi:cytosine/adenosine deaminase-related metal-dependent hydrolase
VSRGKIVKLLIKGGILVTPIKIIYDADILIEKNKIAKIGKIEEKVDCKIELKKKCFIFPSLINAHDHLLGSYYPRIGDGPYINWLPWDEDLKSHPIYQERNKIDNIDLYFLGAYKNLISGVTIVSDHIPHAVNQEFIELMPIKVLKDYTLEHEITSYDLRWGRGITTEHNEAKEKDIPFITHIQEGFDEEACLGVNILKELNALDEYTVLVHGISFSESDIMEIAKANANVVWCPSSNYFMFKKTTNIKSLLKRNINVSLGTDSPMSGGLNILDEMKFAHSLYKKIYNEELEYKKLVEMVTVNPAKALRLKNTGMIEEGFLANLVVIKAGKYVDPYEAIVKSWFNDIELVIIEGKPLYGYPEYFSGLEKTKGYEHISIKGKERILWGNLSKVFKRIYQRIGYNKILPFLPVDSIIY